MKTMIIKIMTAVKPVALLVIACGALPLCLAALAGLIGFGIVVTLDVWGDFYFVDGVPSAAAFIIGIGLCGLWFLQTRNEASVRWARFATPYKQAKAALSSLDTAQLAHFVSGALNKARQFGRQTSQYATSNIAPNITSNVHPRTGNKAVPLVHSVVWGKPIDRHYDLKRSLNLEVDQNYAARK